MTLFPGQCRALVKLALLELWRRNDIFGLLVFALALLVPLAAAAPFGAAGATRYMDEAAFLLIWGYSIFLALGTGARAFPPEFESRTIHPLLSKPLSRGALVFGKFLGACAASLSALLFFYLLFALAMGLRGGPWFPPELLQAFALHAAFVALAVSVALLGSLMMTPSANLALSALVLIAMLFFGRRIPDYAGAVAAPLRWPLYAAYALAPHAEFFDMRQRVIHGWGGVDAAVFAAVLAYACLYVAACLLLANAALRRKPL